MMVSGFILVGQRIVCNRPYPVENVQFVALFQRIHISFEWQNWLSSVHTLDQHLNLQIK